MRRGPDNSSVSLGFSLDFSSKTRQLSSAQHNCGVRSVNTLLNNSSVSINSSALFQENIHAKAKIDRLLVESGFDLAGNKEFLVSIRQNGSQWTPYLLLVLFRSDQVRRLVFQIYKSTFQSSPCCQPRDCFGVGGEGRSASTS